MITDSKCPPTEITPQNGSRAIGDSDPAAGLDPWSNVAGADGSSALRPLPPAPESTARNTGSGGRTVEDLTLRPTVGCVFLGFRLVEEIGRGAFSRVYLAEQGDLADRHVVVKVTTDARRESNALARLQHTNIVPIHSAHRSGTYHLVCMPYLGTVTLVDVYRDLEGMPTLPNSGRDLFTTLTVRRSGTVSTDPPTGTPKPEVPQRAHEPVLASLQGRSYIEAVLWLAARLAEGLAHAHDRGVVHRDLKPANILLTDDRQPMLLDFNLSGSAGSGVVRGGGTPPYMSPEQFDAFAGNPRGLDGRTDLYSLGVVVYELLTRRSPFPRYKDAAAESLRAMIADRQGPPPGLRKWNRAITPAVESIVRHCLEPDPANRYQSAHELKEDIERHLADQPLKHAPEPSARERVRKWRRRNRVLTSANGMVTTAVVAVAVLAGAYLSWGARLARMEAADAYRQFTAEAQTAQVLLLDRNADRGRLDEGARVCETALARFGVLDRPDWEDGPVVSNLPQADRDRLRDEVGGVLYLLAKATAQQATRDAGRADPQPGLRRSFEMTDAALACYAGRSEPRAVWEQRAELARLLGRPEEARATARRAAELPVESGADRFLLAHQYAAQGEHRKALPLLRDVTRDDPRSFVAWFVQGVCNLELLRDADAVGCFNSCIALRPDYHWAWYNRGLAARRQRNFEQAKADFDQVVKLRPEFALGYMNRGLAKQELKDYAGAAADLTTALDLGGPATSILFRRAAVHRLAKDAAAADRDFREALRREPADEDGFIDRGLARVHRDAAAALADFDAALKLNPQSYRGLQNKAAILSDKFQRDADALTVIDEAVRLYPDAVLARAGRGVLLARAGQADRAVEDATAAARLDASPATLYQVACIYALVSATKAEYRAKAVQLLSAAVKQGYGHELIEKDPDLAAVRGLPEYRPLAEAARSLGKAGR